MQSASIPSDKVVVVTGDPRSGTSLIMQTLVHLDVPVAGQRFLNGERSNRGGENSPDPCNASSGLPAEGSVDFLHSLNPRGFYEVPGVVKRGLQSVEEYGGQAIKIISPAAYPRVRNTEQSWGTPAEIVHRYILCLRDPRSVAVSQTHLKRPTRMAGEKDWQRVPLQANPSRFLLDNGGLAEFMLSQEEGFRASWIVIDYDAFLADPPSIVDKIAAHLKFVPSDTARAAAIENVEPTLRRSAGQLQAWPEKFLKEGELATELYMALREHNIDHMRTVTNNIARHREFLRLEHVRWYDETLGVLLTPSLARALQAKPTLRQQYKAVFQRELKGGLHPCTSPSYAEPADATKYTINRPDDLGPLVRRKVCYQGQLVTREEAFLQHQQERLKRSEIDRATPP